jgi:hypothetical protein
VCISPNRSTKPCARPPSASGPKSKGRGRNTVSPAEVSMQRPCVRIALKWSPRALKTTSTLGRASLAHRSSRLRHLFRIPQSVSPVPLILDRSLSRREFGHQSPSKERNCHVALGGKSAARSPRRWPAFGARRAACALNGPRRCPIAVGLIKGMPGTTARVFTNLAIGRRAAEQSPA